MLLSRIAQSSHDMQYPTTGSMQLCEPATSVPVVHAVQNRRNLRTVSVGRQQFEPANNSLTTLPAAAQRLYSSAKISHWAPQLLDACCRQLQKGRQETQFLATQTEKALVAAGQWRLTEWIAQWW